MTKRAFSRPNEVGFLACTERRRLPGAGRGRFDRANLMRHRDQQVSSKRGKVMGQFNYNGAISALAICRAPLHIANMALGPSPVHFKPHPVKRGDGWYVQVTWDNGRTAQVPNFATEADAEQWIKHESAVWLAERHTGSHDQYKAPKRVPRPD